MPPPLDQIAVKRSDLAPFLGLTGRQVKNLIDDGIITKPEGDSLYNLKQAVTQYCEYQRDLAQKRGKSSKAEELDLRKKTLVVDRMEREEMQENGQLIPVDEVAEAVTGAFIIVRDQLLAIPDAMEAEHELSPVHLEALEGKCNSALSNLEERLGAFDGE